jgi:hypothetical protein
MYTSLLFFDRGWGCPPPLTRCMLPVNLAVEERDCGHRRAAGDRSADESRPKITLAARRTESR